MFDRFEVTLPPHTDVPWHALPYCPENLAPLMIQGGREARSLGECVNLGLSFHSLLLQGCLVYEAEALEILDREVLGPLVEVYPRLLGQGLQ